jgi:diguanylate cyclase
LIKSAYQLSPQELEEILSVLNQAINNHRVWFNNLHTSIVCHQPFASDILNEAAHTQCEFGKWYYGDSSNAVKSFKEYAALESVHQFMHDNARELAMLSSSDKPIAVDAYQTFLGNQRRLIDLLTELRDILIEHQYCFDALTGAINRKAISLLLEQSFENMRRYHQTYTVAMVDVDHFKGFNDEYGHVVGDQVLKHISSFFEKNLRHTDCVGRYGGEEFLIMMPETNIETAHKVLEKARKDLANSGIIVDETSLHVTFSAGMSQVLDEDDDAWVAVQRADAALYDAKKSGRDRIKVMD